MRGQWRIQVERRGVLLPPWLVFLRYFYNYNIWLKKGNLIFKNSPPSLGWILDHPLQISFEKNIIKLLDNIIVLLPKTTCGVVEIYGGTLDEGSELDGQQRNYIRSSRRLYIITYRSFSRITDALTSIGEIFYLLPLICPTKRYNISRRSLLSSCTYNV